MGFISSAGVIRCIRRVWPLLLLVWLGCFIFGAIYGFNLFLHTDNMVPATPGTPSAIANKIFENTFSDIGKYSPWVIILECPDKLSDDYLVAGTGCDGTGEYGPTINNNTQSIFTEINDVIKNKHHNIFNTDLTMSWFTVPDKLKTNFVAQDGKATILTLSAYRNVTQSVRFTAIDTLNDILPGIKAKYCTNCSVLSHSGGDSLTYEISHSLATMLLKSEAFIIPITFIVFLYMVNWNWRLLLITGFQLGTSILTAFGISEWIATAQGVRPQSITPQMIEVITMAISIDYALFTFVRFQEDLKLKQRRFAIRRKNYMATVTSDFKSKNDQFVAPAVLPVVGREYFGLVYDTGLDSAEDPHPSQSSGVAYQLTTSALISTFAASGHVVMSSGTTLLLSFAGFFLINNSFLLQPALFTAIGVLFAIMTSLTVPYAAILAAPAFFTDPNFFPAWVYNCCCKKRRQVSMFDVDFTGDEIFIDDPDDETDDIVVSNARRFGTTPNRLQTHSSFALENDDNYPVAVNDQQNLLSSGRGGYGTLNSSTDPRIPQQQQVSPSYEAGVGVVDLKAFKKSLSWRLGKYLVRFPGNIIVMLLVFGVLGYFASHLKDLSLTSAYQLGLPRNSQGVKVYHTITDHFPPGVIQPLYYMVEYTPDHDGGIYDDELFTVGVDILKTIHNETNGMITANYTQSPFFFDGAYVETGADAKQHIWDLSYLAVWTKTVYPFIETDAKAGEPITMLLTLLSPIPPDHPTATTYIKTTRENVIDKLNNKYADKNIKLYLAGYKPQEEDTISKVESRYTLMMTVTFCVVMVFVSIVLKSVLVPIRLTLTLALPIAAVFGACIMVYQKDMLAWMGIDALRSHNGITQIYWELPVFVGVVLLSLALDYDIFILTRVIELRTQHNYTSEASILLALYKSGPVISAAGILMSLSFCPLFFLESQACAELGFLLVVGVLVDTFVIRPILVPCVFSLADSVAWWPRKVPTRNLRDVDGTIVN